ncbi:hypothetical protein SAMN02983003_3155 [Devosia enhydra]|uniref:Uncharacterized protein n=1 Tax=Devosia enhydra TaxID=665118 RepID=A0A1K2I129_9HYPH|nr:hypothetical protein [Devosia enhydra]SFZ85983.1 hypothetical protein SAMN02983003_3155 [Devosia enhydra]
MVSKVKKRSRVRGPRKLPVEAPTVRELAAKLDEHFGKRMAEGYELAKASGFWLVPNGTITARLVYRKGHRADEEGLTEMTYTIRGIPAPK